MSRLLVTNKSFELLEPYEGKLSRTVLRGESSRKGADLLDIDAMVYGPVAQLGWHAVTTQINAEGQVDGTCVGTGMAFDPAFYYYRPVNVYAAHGYGPVLWAGAEMINMLNKQHPKMNDSAVQYYRTEQKTSEPIFHVMDGGAK